MMKHKDMVRAFNEWIRLYIEDPAGFEAEFQTVSAYLVEKADSINRPDIYGSGYRIYLRTLPAAFLIVQWSHGLTAEERLSWAASPKYL